MAMTTQPSLPGVPPPPARPQRRCRWRAELSRLAQLHADERARDEQRHAAALGRLAAQLDDLRHRLLDLERQTGASDLRIAPRTRQALRAHVAGEVRRRMR